MSSGRNACNILNCRFIQLLCMFSFCVRIHLCVCYVLGSIACAYRPLVMLSVLVYKSCPNYNIIKMLK